MLSLKPQPKIADLLALDERLSAERWMELSALWKPMIVLQGLPDIALIIESGVYLPPHQRAMLYTAHLGATTNLYPCSRGTAKSTTLGVLYSSYCNLHFARRNWITLSATGFRGGQYIFNDVENWMQGGWGSQTLDKPFFRSSVPNKPNPVKRAQNYWEVIYDSLSKNLTMPTQNEDLMRGARAKDLIIDEANIAEKTMIEKVAVPFLNVKDDMRHGGVYGDDNRLFLLSTVDYSWRAWAGMIAAAKTAQQRDFEAYTALKAGDRQRYAKLRAQGLLEYNLTQYDYSDIFIRRYITTRDGRVMEVSYPDREIPLVRDERGLPFLYRDATGRLRRESPPVEYWPTYSLDKRSLERGLFDGSADEAGWKAEQRNITDTAVGDVYHNVLVDEASCEGERCIIPYKKLPESWRQKYQQEQLDYIPPVLWSCTDPCVLGVDYAPLKDFCAFVVIRMGFLGKGDFDPFTHTGFTPWSNVIWCEMYRQMSYREVADKIRMLGRRYNLYWVDDYYADPELACRAIGLDMFGGGHGVRDELAFLNGDLPEDGVRIYDPFDPDDRVREFKKDAHTLPMLNAIKPSPQLNETLVDFTIAQMQQGYLYLPKWVDKSERTAGHREIDVGYDASRALTRQLRKLRQEPTKSHRRFYMDGDTNKVENKKDLWAAYIYAAKQLRAHLIRQQQIDNTPPPIGARIARAGSKMGRGINGRAAGARY